MKHSFDITFWKQNVLTFIVVLFFFSFSILLLLLSLRVALIDDLFGNTDELTSAPTPKPLNMGRQYNKYYSLVKGLLDNYNAQALAQITDGDKNDGDDSANDNDNGIDNDNDSSDNNSISAPLPTDKQISLLLRSYRDKHKNASKNINNRTKALGITKALKHLVAEMKIPTRLFGERTYSALMYCAATPKEARRIMKMMQDNGYSPDEYSYSILVDIHAKAGDFRGADKVLAEMRFEGIEPTLAAYTSLLAACYKGINTATVPQAIKAEAGTLAWNRWKELIINGLEPDVMAYGAIIRIMAARGFPERAVNIIEEMQMKDVKPTTLIFTAALQSVSRSHANILRFQGGYSKKDKRRERITAHHGKLARQILILAEQAQVKQDDGFVSALMICAATAGDSATAKAIYLASEVRKLEHLRLIGGPEHLSQLRGGDKRRSDDVLAIESNVKNLSISDGKLDNVETSIENEINELTSKDIDNVELAEAEKNKELKPQYKRKSNDTRKLAALLRASANAVEKRGLGNMWQGMTNKGFLCENSLRLINARYQPKYVDKSLPGLDGSESGLASMEWDDDDDAHTMGKRLRRKKFMGLLKDTEDNTIDDLDPSLYNLFYGEEDDEGLDASKDNDGSLDSTETNFQTNGTGVIEMPRKPNSIQQTDDISCENIDDEFLASEIESIFAKEIDEKKHDVEKISLDHNQSSEFSFEGDRINFEPEESSTEEETISDPVEENQVAIVPNDEFSLEEIKMDENKDELDIILYGMPQPRIKRVRKEFKSTLGDPSMLRLIPMLRENMPDIIEPKWLKEKNVRDARFVMDKAKEDGVVDIHLMNSMLQVLAKSNNIDEALAFHDEQYALHNMVST